MYQDKSGIKINFDTLTTQEGQLMMKCRIMWHLIWDFTVFKSTGLEVYPIQRDIAIADNYIFISPHKKNTL